MTTAHRPTWKAAVGQANEGGWTAGGARSAMSSALDAPAHLALKVRHGAQKVDKRKALQESLLELEQAEKQVTLGNRPVDPAIEERSQQRLLKQTAEVNVDEIKDKYDDSDAGGGNSDSSESDLDVSDSDLDKDSDDESSDDEDEEAALQAELAKIRAERQAAQQKVEEEEASQENASLEQAALLGNPLLASSEPKKRKWNDDVVFRNQAKGEPVPKKRFINDTVRNDFHKRFLNKFIK